MTNIAHDVGVSGNAYAVRNTATSAGGQGAESTGPSILNEAGLGSRQGVRRDNWQPPGSAKHSRADGCVVGIISGRRGVQSAQGRMGALWDMCDRWDV